MAIVPNIAVLITSHNRKDKTLHCLEALYLQQGIHDDFNMDVFLVDDASEDGTAVEVKSRYPDVNLISGDGNLFWNRGMYLAWEKAKETNEYDYYLWLNDDTFLFKNAIIILLKDAKASNYISAICGAAFSLKHQTMSYGGFSKDDKILTPDGSSQEAYIFNGNCVLIPKYVFNIVGMLDKRYPHAIGDYDYALRIREQNLKSYASSEFIGTCERNESLPLWCSTTVSLRRRIQNLYSPLGSSHPYYYFIFERRHYGLGVAVKHFFSIHLRLLIPQLWK